MNILITGGAGFVGSHLCEKLRSQGHKVWSLDNYFSGSYENHVEGVDYLVGETLDIAKIFKDVNIDLVYHLGEYSRVEQSFDDIDICFKSNWESIYAVLKFVRSTGAKIVYSGSSTKFGDDGEAIYTSPYAFTKKCNADLVKTYCEWFNIKYAITYFYNVYGPREISEGRYATVIAKFLKLKRAGSRQATVTKPGTQARNFTDIRDIVNGLSIVGQKGLGDGFGIGAKESYTILDLCDMMKLNPRMTKFVKGNRLSAPVLTKKTEDLGWKQQYKLIDYINWELFAEKD